MVLFRKTFKESESIFRFNWTVLKKESQLEDILTHSNTKTVVIFKHSTRCGISRNVLKQFEFENKIKTDKIYFYYLDLLKFRNISNAIADRFNVFHQSPQLIVLKSGKVTTNASHYDILNINLN